MEEESNWDIDCCNEEHIESISLIVGYAVIIFKLWRVPILHPFKILTVFLHELGHAIAVWCTCGKVTGMEVHPNEGGVTKHIGGIQFIILPAGYLGSAIWGMALVIASADRIGAEVCAIVLIVFLTLFIFYAKNCYLRGLNLLFILLLGGLLAVNIVQKINALFYLTLFIGVMSCLFSIYDIWDDLISRRVNESDASRFAALTHTSSRCWGLIWGLIAVGTLAAAVYFNLWLLNDAGAKVKSLADMGTSSKASFWFAIVTVAVSILHTLVTRRCMVRLTCRRADDSYVSA